MSDNRNITGNQDRSRVAAEQEHEVDYLVQKLNVSKEEVVRAIESVGNNREKVEEWLRSNKR